MIYLRVSPANLSAELTGWICRAGCSLPAVDVIACYSLDTARAIHDHLSKRGHRLEKIEGDQATPARWTKKEALVFSTWLTNQKQEDRAFRGL